MQQDNEFIPHESDCKIFKAHTIVFTKYGKEADEDPEAWLKLASESCDWIFGQQELCPTTKRIHIQGMAWCKNQSRWGFLNGESCWKRKCISPLDSIAYCSKSETKLAGPWEFGNRPTWKAIGDKKKKRAEQNKILIEKDIISLVEEGDINFGSVPTMIKAKNFWSMIKPGDPKDKDENEWIYGKPGCGKTRYVKEKYPDLYQKAQNKWWDSYKGQEIVLIDDFDRQGKCLGHYLKIWGDRYFGWPGETKGGTIQPNFRKLIVTSNYTPEQLFGGEDGDSELVEAIERRFRMGAMDRNGQITFNR